MFGFIHVMGGDENRVSGRRELVDQIPKVAASNRIDARGRLIEKYDGGLVQDGASQGQPLLPSAGQQARHRRPPLAQPCHGQHVLLALGTPLLCNSVDPAEEINVLLHRQIVIERELLGHIADMFSDVLRFGRHIEPAYASPAIARGEQPAENANGGRLAGSVGAEEAENLAPTDGEGNVVYGDKGAESLHEAIYLDGPPMVISLRPLGHGSLRPLSHGSLRPLSHGSLRPLSHGSLRLSSPLQPCGSRR